MKLEEFEQLHPHVQFERLTFLTPNTHCAWRVDTLLTKEPDTLEWISKMKSGEVLFDVGANMGQYSMIAAQHGVNVHAFEPEGQNFALMCRNFAINKLKGKLMPWPIALTSASDGGLGSFHVTTLQAGGSCNSFKDKVDYHLKPKQFKFEQGMFGCTLDTFCSTMRVVPDHIKIDVDGLEHKVISGALATLPGVKSILVELNTGLDLHLDIMANMAGMGFHADMDTANKARRKSGPFKGVGNVVFFRDPKDFLNVPEERWKPL